MNNNDLPKVELNYVTFAFDWTWIKDKIIIHKGNQYGGMLIITDEDGLPVKMFGYELVNKDEDDIF